MFKLIFILKNDNWNMLYLYNLYNYLFMDKWDIYLKQYTNKKISYNDLMKYYKLLKYRNNYNIEYKAHDLKTDYINQYNKGLISYKELKNLINSIKNKS